MHQLYASHLTYASDSIIMEDVSTTTGACVAWNLIDTILLTPSIVG
jgi:hypothetical protein